MHEATGRMCELFKIVVKFRVLCFAFRVLRFDLASQIAAAIRNFKPEIRNSLTQPLLEFMHFLAAYDYIFLHRWFEK